MHLDEQSLLVIPWSVCGVPGRIWCVQPNSGGARWTFEDGFPHAKRKPILCETGKVFFCPREGVFSRALDQTQTDMDDRKMVQAIQEWETPTKVIELQSFLGLVNYYRWFLKSYLAKAALFTDLVYGLTLGMDSCMWGGICRTKEGCDWETCVEPSWAH